MVGCPVITLVEVIVPESGAFVVTVPVTTDELTIVPERYATPSVYIDPVTTDVLTIVPDNGAGVVNVPDIAEVLVIVPRIYGIEEYPAPRYAEPR